MATPSSSATSPSPPMVYLTQAPLHPGEPDGQQSASTTSQEREDRKRAVQRFLARAEVSMVTRALRARLAYASYKATHNIPHVSLRDLEEQTTSQTHVQTPPFSRTIAAKRKVGGPNTTVSGHYLNPATRAGGLRRAGSNLVPPAQRANYYNTVNGAGSVTAGNVTNRGGATLAGGVSSVGQAQSLYASLLAPPPSKQVRTIHNAHDAPIAAPVRSMASPRVKARDGGAHGHTTTRSIAEGTRTQAKSRREPASPRTKRSAKGKQRQRTTAGPGKSSMSHAMDVDEDGDVDMKAAATLTSLMRQSKHRGSASISVSAAGSASSPRSSIDGAASEAGSVGSYAHYLQSSSRAAGDGSSTSVPAPDPSYRPQTPVPETRDDPKLTTTPRPAPTDSEAADLMLFLATSPSPARAPSAKDRNAQDLAAFRALGPRAKARVLFPTASPVSNATASRNNAAEDESRSNLAAVPRPLVRGSGGENSFVSSISSIGSQLGFEGGSATMGVSSGRSTPTPTPAQLLPPPSLAGPRRGSGSPSAPNPISRTHKSSQSLPLPDSQSSPGPYPPMSSSAPAEFNFSDYIHASPSPRANNTPSQPRPNLGLRADVGRKLFEEEQMRLGMARSLGQEHNDVNTNLGASIDLSS